MSELSALPASRIGLGMAALGRPGYINLGHAQDLPAGHGADDMRRQAFEVLDAAYAGGVRSFDVARSYGRGEEFLADWLRERQVAAGSVQVGSKWGYTYVADWQVQALQHEVKEHSLRNFDRQWPQTEALLGGWLKVYLAHSVTPDSPLWTDRPLQDRLARLRGLGVTPGLSLSGPRQGEVLEQALELHLNGEPVFGAVQATWNLLEPSAGPALLAAHEAGWQVVLKEGVANGRLTERGMTDSGMTGALQPRQTRTLQALCQRHGAAPDALALAAALAQPFAHLVLSGASTTAHLASNLTALRLNLSAADLSELEQLKETPAEYWQTRSRLAWN
ncbi:aldo/keto reductase [Deinococcus altitudinis]|uniref:aldo/keto reductase n=1 Tax=Deinococcus altitudinis TaxID=468914 RepID=UPI003892722F